MQQRIIARVEFELLNVVRRPDLVAALTFAAKSHTAPGDTALIIPKGPVMYDLIAVGPGVVKNLPCVGGCFPSEVGNFHTVDVEVSQDDLREDEDGSGKEGDWGKVHGGR